MILKERLRNLLTVRETPHRIAFAFAVGLFVGISPLLGLHTILGLAFAWLLGLNRMVTLTGVYVTNPWSMVPIYTFCTWIGMLIVGVDIALTEINWRHMKMNAIALEFRQILVPFVVGSTVVAAAAAFLAYFIVRIVVEKSRHGLNGRTATPEILQPGGERKEGN